MHRNLTVREVLYYQAMLRLPAGTNGKTIKKNINQVPLVFYDTGVFLACLVLLPDDQNNSKQWFHFT